MRKIKVAQVVNQLSIGGTEKTVEIFANLLDKNIFDVSIFALNAGGVRYDALKNKFNTLILNGDLDKFGRLLQENQIDIMHIHRCGYEEPHPVAAAKKAGVPIVVETKIFGASDHGQSQGMVDLSLFISKMCAIRYMKKEKLSAADFIKKHRVLYNPIETDKFQINRSEVDAFKKSLGIAPSDFVIGRVSRADPFKFGNVCLNMLPYLLQEIKNIKYIIVGCPPQKMKIIKNLKLGDRVITIPEIEDERSLTVFYETIDLFAYAAYHGESFGITIAEAMAHHKPVVVNSTPAMDNAQVELVDHGQTGYIANWPFNYAKAVARLLKDNNLSETFGENGYQKVLKYYQANKITKFLENYYFELLVNKGIISKNDIPNYLDIPSNVNVAELIAFKKEYDQRKRQQFNQFTPFEMIKGLSQRLLSK